MTQDDHLTEKAIDQLAVSGALCQRCGGLHLTKIEDLILLLANERGLPREKRLPTCVCSPCGSCGTWKPEFLATLKELMTAPSDWSKK